MPEIAKPERYKLSLLFLETKGYKKDALDKRLLVNRRYEAISRRPEQSLQDFFATENVAYADAVKAGVGIDPDRRAYHTFILSGLTDDQINHIYSFMYDPEAVGQSASLDHREIQKDALRQPWSVDRHRDSRTVSGPIFTTSDVTCCNDHAQTPDVASSSVQGKHGQLRASALRRRELAGRRMATSTVIGTTLPLPGNSIQPKRKVTWKPSWQETLTGSTVIC